MNVPVVCLASLAKYSGWPGHYNNVGCSARLEISFELNLLPRVNKVTLLYFTFTFLYKQFYILVSAAGSCGHLYCIYIFHLCYLLIRIPGKSYLTRTQRMEAVKVHSVSGHQSKSEDQSHPYDNFSI